MSEYIDEAFVARLREPIYEPEEAPVPVPVAERKPSIFLCCEKHAPRLYSKVRYERTCPECGTRLNADICNIYGVVGDYACPKCGAAYNIDTRATWDCHQSR